MPTIPSFSLRLGGVVPRPDKSFENSKVEIELYFSLDSDETPEQVIEEHVEALNELVNGCHELVQSSRSS